MSIEKKSLISNRAATKKANLTKVNAATQVSATKVAQPKLAGGNVRVASHAKLAAPMISARTKLATTLVRMSVRGK